ncbi:DUF4272 domain-containing protein [Vibrio splendidus]|uniref:DUF4272 domain-containing protein n=1 Tax=Vibrio splendidus TaxID=29497 RepID=UPI001E5FECFE|nr:DUF4272 domain-containing protein [Vibrio splendidus]MCC4860809.1 DUF4272 domain-containing protein [Vibrio splendidus]
MNNLALTIGGESEDTPRSSKEIAERALCLFVLIEHVMTDHEDAMERRLWLEDKGLTNSLTKPEREFLYSDNPTKQQDINTSWLSECLCILLWSIGYHATIPSNSIKYDAESCMDFMPEYSDVTVDEFISKSLRRSLPDLYKMALDIQSAHREAIDISGASEIIQERHLAINWVVGYCGLPWELVTTDT